MCVFQAPFKPRTRSSSRGRSPSRRSPSRRKSPGRKPKPVQNNVNANSNSTEKSNKIEKEVTNTVTTVRSRAVKAESTPLRQSPRLAKVSKKLPMLS